VTITYVSVMFEGGTLPLSQQCLLHSRRTYLQVLLRLRKFLAMYPDPPTWCSIIHRSKHESQVPHYLPSTYFKTNPSDRPSIDGVAASSTSETVPFERNVPKPFPSGLSCDCTNSAKYTFSLLYFNRTAGGSKDRSVNEAKAQPPARICTYEVRSSRLTPRESRRLAVKG